MENNLRVLFLDTRPIRRGAQVFIHELKSRFKKDGIAVKRVFLYKESNYEQLILDDTDVVLPFNVNNIFEKFPTVHPSIIIELAKEIRAFAPDIILCNGSRTLKYAAVVKRFYPSIKSKWIYRVIDSAVYWNKRSITQFYYRHFVIPAMDGAVGVSQKSLHEMIHHYGFKMPSVCIPRAIYVDYFSEYITEENARENAGIKADSFVLLFLGNFTNQKRPDRFLDIIDELKKQIPNVHGLMVGDGPLRGDVDKQIGGLGLIDKITLAGYQRDVRPWISMSNILLLTSDTEGMPGVVLEAAAMKKVTISSNVGGIKEVITNGKNGFVIPDNSLEGFAQIIVKLFSDENINKSLAENIFNTISSGYDINDISSLYLSFFERIKIVDKNE